ncbi:MAG: LamG domain-containing protein [Planctomycetota bacterium]
MKVWLKVSVVCLVGLMVSNIALAGELKAYYTKVDSGQDFEKYSRTGPYADIVIEVGDGKFVFWRGSSYLPYWETDEGKFFVEELIPRSGDGPAKRPDIVNTFSRVMLVESCDEEAVVCWRYLPQFGGKNPHTGVDATKFVDEYFTITSDGKVKRTIRKGTAKIDDWRDPLNKTVQTFELTCSGLSNVKTEKPSSSAAAAPVKGVEIKTTSVKSPAAWWRFDEAQGDIAVESVSGAKYTIEGHKSLWKKGVSGTALQFDGYNTLIELPASKAPQVSSGITLEGWVSIGAYPWSWTPIIQQDDDVEEVLEKMTGPRAWLTGEDEREDMEEPSDDFTFVLKKEDDVGYFLGIDGLGHPALKVKVGETWQELTSNAHLERKQWYHVAGTYDKETGKMLIYVDGKPAGEKSVSKSDIVMSDKDVKIGKGKPRRPIKPVRANTFMDSYGFDGLIDEVKIYTSALSAAEVEKSFQDFKPDESEKKNADMVKRVLPEGKSTGEFGAYYARLDYYETWDNLWRFSEHPDVVVELGNIPGKFVFWRGVGYIPMMVNENGQWYTNEFNETWNRSGGQGCQEPMSDKESYTNHARIIENTDARVVVHWRYPLIDVLHVIANYHDDTGWGDWSDWYYYIYPDGVAVKTMHLWTDGERDHEWQEGIAVFGPDQHPEQVLETEPALILASLDGDVDEHNWIGGPPEDVSYRKKKIHIVNYQAEYDPFAIGNFRGGNIYGGELTDYAVFPTWNHWPVGQMPSDGRYASFPDRTGHSSLTHVWMPTYKEDFGDRPFQEKLLMEGLSDKSAEELMPLAKSWLNPAKIEAVSGCESAEYDRGQRAYVIEASDSKIVVKIKGSEDSPIVNPAFVISNLDYDEASLTINGKKIECGKDLRIGHPTTVVDKDLVVWVRFESDKAAEFVIEAAE